MGDALIRLAQKLGPNHVALTRIFIPPYPRMRLGRMENVDGYWRDVESLDELDPDERASYDRGMSLPTPPDPLRAGRVMGSPHLGVMQRVSEKVMGPDIEDLGTVSALQGVSSDYLGRVGQTVTVQRHGGGEVTGQVLPISTSRSLALQWNRPAAGGRIGRILPAGPQVTHVPVEDIRTLSPGEEVVGSPSIRERLKAIFEGPSVYMPVQPRTNPVNLLHLLPTSSEEEAYPDDPKLQAIYDDLNLGTRTRAELITLRDSVPLDARQLEAVNNEITYLDEEEGLAGID